MEKNYFYSQWNKNEKSIFVYKLNGNENYFYFHSNRDIQKLEFALNGKNILLKYI